MYKSEHKIIWKLNQLNFWLLVMVWWAGLNPDLVGSTIFFFSVEIRFHSFLNSYNQIGFRLQLFWHKMHQSSTHRGPAVILVHSVICWGNLISSERKWLVKAARLQNKTPSYSCSFIMMGGWFQVCICMQISSAFNSCHCSCQGVAVYKCEPVYC